MAKAALQAVKNDGLKGILNVEKIKEAASVLVTELERRIEFVCRDTGASFFLRFLEMINLHEVENLKQKRFEVKLQRDVHKTPCFMYYPRIQLEHLSFRLCGLDTSLVLTLLPGMERFVGDSSLKQELYQTIMIW